MTEHLLIGIVSILVLGITAQWIAWRVKTPAILLLLIFGIVAGPITNFLNPDELLGALLSPLVSLSVAIILFEGGLSLRFSELKEVGKTVGKLITMGVLISWSVTTFLAYYLIDLGWETSVLFGAILIVTGPTVIIPLLRQVRPSERVRSILKWEGIINDPIGAMLAVLVFELMLAGGFSLTSKTALMTIVNTLFYGSLFGGAGALAIYYLLKNFIVPDFLQNPVSLVIVITIFATSNIFQDESGLLAVTFMGILLANQKNVHIKHIISFKENLRVLLLSALFIMLSARLTFQHLEHFDLYAALFVVALILLVRPLSILIPTIGAEISFKEKLFLSFMAPRGIVAAAISAIFALRLSEAGYESAELLVPYTFLVIIFTVSVYGLSANLIARSLGVKKPQPKGLLILGAHSWAREIAQLIKQEGFKVLMAENNWDHIAKARQDGLNTYYGSILAEYALDEINLDGIGTLLAMTANDEANSLAVVRYVEIFDSSHVYQLAPLSKQKKVEQEVPQHLSGRTLFDKDLNFTEIEHLLTDGASFECVELGKNETFEDFYDNHSDNNIPLFSITSTNDIVVNSEDNPNVPTDAHKVIYFKIPDQHEDDTPSESEENQKPLLSS